MVVLVVVPIPQRRIWWIWLWWIRPWLLWKEGELVKLSLDTSEEDMVDTAVATMERGRLMLSLDTSEEDMVDMDMVVMAVATTERG